MERQAWDGWPEMIWEDWTGEILALQVRERGGEEEGEGEEGRGGG